MASILNASTSLGLQHSGDTSGILKFQTASTDAITIDASQNITLNTGTANGVAYLNGSKVLTTNGTLSFDGTTLTSTRFTGALNGSVGAITPSTGSFTTLSASTSFTEAGYNVVTQADIGSGANEIPLNQYLGKLAFMNPEAVVLNPPASVTPVGLGDMVFQLTNNTTLLVKVRGSDGTVRSATLTLA